MVQADGLSIRGEGWLLGNRRAVVWKLHWYAKEKLCWMTASVLRVREVVRNTQRSLERTVFYKGSRSERHFQKTGGIPPKGN